MFGAHAPDYIAHRLAVFPTGGDDGKRPLVGNYSRMGLPASRRLSQAQRFRTANVGFCTGPRSGLTVVDVDSQKESDFAAALAHFGDTPVKIQSGSGHFQAWYRHGGERRQIRALDKIDILGTGLCIAPPSVRPDRDNGAYRFLEGSLDDLDRLPALKSPVAPSQAGPAHVSTGGAEQGQRNISLFRQCLKDLAEGWPADELPARACAWNEQCTPPLPEAEVMAVAASAIRYHERGENWIGQEARAHITASELGDLGGNGDAVLLLMKVRAAHGWRCGEPFPLAMALGETLGWHPKKFRQVRGFLCERDYLECVHPGGAGPGDPALYRLLK
ncbi:MAG: bifunctional DNA primase/polymerase [Rhodospirillales bacterium]